MTLDDLLDEFKVAGLHPGDEIRLYVSDGKHLTGFVEGVEVHQNEDGYVEAYLNTEE